MDETGNRKTSFEILEKADVPSRRVPAGEVILSKGSQSREMFIVRGGRVAVSVGDTVVEEVGSGGIFGEMALIDTGGRSATVTALDDCDLVPIDERMFLLLVKQSPSFALDVMGTLVARIRALNELIARPPSVPG